MTTVSKGEFLVGWFQGTIYIAAGHEASTGCPALSQYGCLRPRLVVLLVQAVLLAAQAALLCLPHGYMRSRPVREAEDIVPKAARERPCSCSAAASPCRSASSSVAELRGWESCGAKRRRKRTMTLEFPLLLEDRIPEHIWLHQW